MTLQDCNTSQWLHEEFGSSNTFWISDSICSQLNKEVLCSIKRCFPDLQTQVKLNLLTSFLYVPRRFVKEWKFELQDVIELARTDAEPWVSMLAGSMKTFPATNCLSTDITDNEYTQHIFDQMANNLRKIVGQQIDVGMLPLEFQYLNKNVQLSMLHQEQANFVTCPATKRETKTTILRRQILQKSAELQPEPLKSGLVTTIPPRTWSMPRKLSKVIPAKKLKID